MLQDQHWLRKHVKQLRQLQQASKPPGDLPARIEARLTRSVARREARRSGVPSVAFDDDLPIIQYHREIATALRDHQVIVVAGETGSGKSTQLPKICLEAGFGIGGMIAHTQPRRIAARSVAARIAEELNSPLGEAVGYKIRFQDKTNPNTYIKLMTDGMLLAEAASDRFLQQYEVIILDEAHERSLNIDFLLGMLHDLLPRRRELRLIITSATIDAARFGDHFGTTETAAPVITVEGRTYPVEVRYRSLEDESDGTSVGSYEAIIRAIHELRNEGDALVFLPTERDIREAAQRLRADALVQTQKLEILPLYARLSTAEQNKIFHPGPARRIVLATNVAESSLTVPRIHCVVDTGTARMSRFSSRLRMQRLPIESVSKASADQRKGRCGRLGPGVCIRLYSEEDFESRPPFTTPEIRRTNLASVILQAKYLRLGEVDQIPFLDPPRPEAIREGYKTLFEIGAVDDYRRLTKIGRTLAQLPVDPRIGRMVLAGQDENCLAEILIIAAALEVQDPRLRPIDKQQAADEQQAEFRHDDSDFLSFLKLWDFVQTQRSNLSRGKFQRMCVQKFLSPARLREWGEVHRQLQQTAVEHGLKPRKRQDDAAAIHRALLTGLLSCAAYRTAEREYTGAGGTKFSLWPGSGLSSKSPRSSGSKAKSPRTTSERTKKGRPALPNWIMAAEWIETGKRYGRTVAKIDPSWLESLGQHLAKRTYSDPHWHARSQSVMAFEKVTLFGLPVVARRRVAYGHLDVETSRQIFIEKGLVEQQMEAADRFFRNNAQVRGEAEQLASKTRQREWILDDYRVHQFYAERIPDDVYDLASLRSALKKNPQLQDLLCLSIKDLLEEESSPDHRDFPESLDIGSMQLPLSYHFEPGADDDGVTVTVPREAVAQLHPEQLEWLVPGLLEQKLVGLIRSLPKSVRRGLVPAPDTASKVAQAMDFGCGAFLPEVAKRFAEISQQRITAASFRTEKLAPHLRMRVKVVDDAGEVQCASRSLAEIRKAATTPAEAAENGEPVEPSQWHRDGIESWDFGELPEEVQIPRGGIQVSFFPALVELDTDQLGLRLLDTRPVADTASHAGVRRLYTKQNKPSLRTQVRHLPRWEEIKLWASSRWPKQELEDQLQCLLSDSAFIGRDGIPRSQPDFEARQCDSGQRIAVATQELAKVIPPLFAAYHSVRLAMDKLRGGRFARSHADIESQLSELLSPRFLVDTPWSWLRHFPRYLDAIAYRIDKLTSGGQARDESNIREVLPFWRRWLDHHESASVGDAAELMEFRWMIEEFRVSLFAQPLGTAMKISPQRLEKQWQKTGFT